MARLKNIQKIFCGFPETVKFFSSEKAIFTGNLINLDPGKVKNSPRELDELRIKIIGGSQGARIINETMPRLFKDMLESFPKLKLKITHQCGREKKTEIQSVYNSLKGNIDFEIHEFIDEMEYFYSHADLIVSRAGALSVSEICASRNIAIFIPLANSIDNHQYENARFIESNKGGWLISQNNKNISELENLIRNILLNPNKLVEASNQIKKLSNKLKKLRENKTPAEFLCECILEIKKDNKKVVYETLSMIDTSKQDNIEISYIEQYRLEFR